MSNLINAKSLILMLVLVAAASGAHAWPYCEEYWVCDGFGCYYEWYCF